MISLAQNYSDFTKYVFTVNVLYMKREVMKKIISDFVSRNESRLFNGQHVPRIFKLSCSVMYLIR